jgi:hypothetical protein
MPAESILGNISQEATQAELLGGVVTLLAAMLDKMPRVDANDRLIVNPSESTSPVTVSSGTITTAGVLQNLGTLSRPADAIPLHLSNAGSMHIYDNIKVS